MELPEQFTGHPGLAHFPAGYRVEDAGRDARRGVVLWHIDNKQPLATLMQPHGYCRPGQPKAYDDIVVCVLNNSST